MESSDGDAKANFLPAKRCRTARQRRKEIINLKSLSMADGEIIEKKGESHSAPLSFPLIPSLHPLLAEENREEQGSSSMTKLACGWVSLVGRRRSMEDAVAVEPEIVDGKFAFFAAYDGHGGARVANACRERLYELVKAEVEEEMTKSNCGSGESVDWTKVLKICFSKMDDEVIKDKYGMMVTGEAAAAGATAAVVIVRKEEVVVACCGDTRVVLSRGGAAVPLSNDHKPDRPDEMERVEATGGRIIDWNGYRVQGVLAVSRSIGDRYLKPYVISEPEVRVKKRIESDEFLIIATDGLWDVISNELACNVVRKCFKGQIRKNCTQQQSAANAAAVLAEVAIAKGSGDNISVIVVELKAKSEVLKPSQCASC